MQNIRKLTSIDKLIELKTIKHIGKLVFTNGCFDIVHAGHVSYLEKARALGNKLVVAVNTDSSIRAIKGEKRPVVPLEYRLKVLDSLYMIDYLLTFNDETPFSLIRMLKPDILVKGADWKGKKIVGEDIVMANGGKVELIDFVPNISTTKIIEKILELHGYK